MNNTERLLLHTLPRWAGVPVTSVLESLKDMWVRGEGPGNHSGLSYDPDGIDGLRDELLVDFVKAPSEGAFGAGGPIQTVDDLNKAMQSIQQRSLAALFCLPRPELRALTLSTPPKPRKRKKPKKPRGPK